jgi:hypothetical protein
MFKMRNMSSTQQTMNIYSNLFSAFMEDNEPNEVLMTMKSKPKTMKSKPKTMKSISTLIPSQVSLTSTATKSEKKGKFIKNKSLTFSVATPYQQLETFPRDQLPIDGIDFEAKQAQRTRAFDTLSNKSDFEKSLTKTRMCNSIEQRKACPHGENCRFAHTADELVINDCLFGDSCRFVYRREGKWVNKTGKRCGHKHPGENKAEYIFRSGIFILPVSLPVRRTLFKNQNSAPRIKVQLDDSPLLSESPPIPHSSPVSPPVVSTISTVAIEQFEEETVLRVPKEFAMQAMEIAIKSGRKNIRLEIV